MKNYRFFYFSLLLFAWIGAVACHSPESSDKSSGIKTGTSPAAEMVKPEEAAKPEEASKPEAAAKPEAAVKPEAAEVKVAAEVKAPQPVYPEFKDLPAPETLTNSRGEEIGRFIATSEDREAGCVALLQNAGYRQTRDERTYIREEGDRPMVVRFSSGEGELNIQMYVTHDPMERYIKIPDPRIPYPFDRDELAAEYGDFHVDGKDAVTYIYYNRDASFVEEYDKRLRAAGFDKSENGVKTIYQKNVDAQVLSVEIETTNARGTDMQIRFLVNPKMR